MNDLTPRQLEILRLAGLSNREVARRLGISSHTVRNHWAAILHRLQCYTRMQAVWMAVEKELITWDDVELGERPEEIDVF